MNNLIQSKELSSAKFLTFYNTFLILLRKTILLTILNTDNGKIVSSDLIMMKHLIIIK